MASACAKPGRVVGYHFFNPVPVMKIVEVVDGELTEPWVGDAMVALAKRYGHKPVRCKDTPGFIVNHAGRGYVPESLRVLQEGVADFATIDRILVDAAGFRLGPFGLLDLVGLDIAHGVMKSMHAQYYGEPKYQPSYLSDPRVAAGLLGRKTGRGWYKYGKDGVAEKIPEIAVPSAKPGFRLVRSGIERLSFEIREHRKQTRARHDLLCRAAGPGRDDDGNSSSS